jgi:transposase
MNATALVKENAKLKAENRQLREQVRLLRTLHFGAKSEKLDREDERQSGLFNEAEDGAFDQQSEAPVETREVKSYTRKVNGAGRKPISEELPREVIEYDIDEEQKTCACGAEKTFIGTDVSERACIVPAKVVVRREKRKKYVCRSCEGTTDDEAGVTTAQGPKHLIAGSIADESLLAWSINEKFEYALPFYRQSKRLTSMGIPLPRATLSRLAIHSADACEPLYELLKANILCGPTINADETSVQVLKEKGRRAQEKSWMWVFFGGPVEKRSVVFQYETGRSHQVAYDFLKTFRGWLQSDDFEVYHRAVRKLRAELNVTIEHVLCWAHARRRFYAYWEISKSEDAQKILDYIRELFELEKLRKDYSKRGFLKQRKNRAGPILKALKDLLIEYSSQTPPGLAFGKAIAYTLDNWELLIKYLDHPDLTPSNNAAENAIRPFVIGRKNWLFSATPRGARASAILYSLVESAKLQRLPVYDYIYYILRKLPYCGTQEDYEALLPHNLTAEMIKP